MSDDDGVAKGSNRGNQIERDLSEDKELVVESDSDVDFQPDSEGSESSESEIDAKMKSVANVATSIKHSQRQAKKRKRTDVLKQKSANTIDGDIGQGSNEQVVARRLDNNADTEEEMGDTPSGGDRVYYLLYNDRKMLMGKLIPTKPGELVHHHALHSRERKFEITRVIDCNTPFWEDLMNIFIQLGHM